MTLLKSVPKGKHTKKRKKVKNYKKKAIELAKYIVRKKVNQCEWCGKVGVKLDGAHIVPVRFSSTAADIDNILCLCSGCHTLSRNSCHENPVLFTRWLDVYAPGRFTRLWEKAQIIGDNIDWESKFKELEALKESLSL